MPEVAKYYFVKIQLWFYGCLALCILIVPEALRANGGISYYSSYTQTIVPYVLGFVVVSWYLFKLSDLYKDRQFRYWCRAIAVLMVVLACVPFSFNSLIETIHTVISTLLFGAQFLFIVVQSLVIKRDVFSIALLLSAVAAITVTLSYLNPVKGYLIVGEVLFQIIFWLTFYRALGDATARQQSRTA